MSRSNPDFLNGVPELLILQLLSGRAMHGYELVQAIRAASDEELSFGEGCVYPLLHRLEGQGFLRSRRTVVDARRRVIYELTKDGQERLSDARTQWSSVARAITRVLTGGEHEQPALDRPSGKTSDRSGAPQELRPPRRGRAA